jgi:hypothetical protein
MTDTGSLPIKMLRDFDDDSSPIGLRSDEAKIIYKLVDMKSGYECHAVNVTSSMVDRLLHTKAISRYHYDAACRFIDDFELAGLRPSMGSNYEPLEPSQGGGMSDVTAAAHGRWVSAVRILGARYGDVCSAILLHDNNNEDTKLLLIDLDRLVKHYGMVG